MLVLARTRQTERTLRLFALTLVASMLTLGLAPQAQSVSADVSRFVSVIVQSVGGSDQARDAVESVGGRVTRDLGIVGGVSAELPERSLPSLRADERVWNVTQNDEVGFHGGADTEVTHRIQKVVGANKLWAQGVTGRGVTVGLLDTGVYAAHPDLAGRVVCGADLTAEAAGDANCQDTFGHGTFMAGLIAGDGTSSNGKYKGAAPGARIVSVKAAGFDGATDVSTILAGIQWFVAHQDQYDIDVLNLSLGSDSAQDYRLSPLNFAVEQAWHEGIAVVVSSGNSGPDNGTVMKPGDDPYVITVGASNDEGSVAAGDDRIPVFSSRGPTRSNGLAKPDVVSPGVHTVSLRSPGSAIDQQFCSQACVDGDYFRGTGTSMSTATVSGVVAQMLQRNPSLTPDQVKHRLMNTAKDIADDDPYSAGAGLVNAYEASMSLSNGIPQVHVGSTGLGLIEGDRGSLGVEIVTPIGQVALLGEFIAQVDPEEVDPTNPAGLMPWLGATWKVEGWGSPEDWAGATWKTDEWAGATWKGATWKATVWDGATWKGATWKNSDWEGATWKGAEWDGATWKASTWQTRMYAASWS
jgi:serine protease AprX